MCGHRRATPLGQNNFPQCLRAALTLSVMEPNGEPSHSNPAGNQPPAGGLHGKRLKERENAFLQNTLITRADPGADAGSWTEQPSGEDEPSTGSSLNHRSAPQLLSTDTETEGVGSVRNGRVDEERVDERTLTDHLNKRLLSSFLEKLNERDLALPGVQRLDCAVADEDSNRAAEEW